jgi:hypothetical protein
MQKILLRVVCAILWSILFPVVNAVKVSGLQRVAAPHKYPTQKELISALKGCPVIK